MVSIVDKLTSSTDLIMKCLGNSVSDKLFESGVFHVLGVSFPLFLLPLPLKGRLVS